MEMWFSADLVFQLAQDGRLAVDEHTADSLIAGLTTALSTTRVHATVLRARQSSSWTEISGRYPAIARLYADVADAEELAPGRTELALRELPTYIMAVQLAKTTSVKQQEQVQV